MSANSKSILITVGSFALSLTVLSILFAQFSNSGFSFLRTLMIVILSAFVFTPIRKAIETDEGKEYHLKWRFNSRVFVFK